jgi:Holliday junction resolvase RusA-like endonuclease
VGVSQVEKMTALRDGWVDVSAVEVEWPQPRPTHYDLAVYIPGAPVPKGSMKGRVLGRGKKVFAQLFHDNEKEQHDWVRQAAASIGAASGMPAEPWAGPVYVWGLAVMPRPKSLGQRLAAMIQKPDGDKILRSVLDVLTVAGVYGDDKQVTDKEMHKRYAKVVEAPGLHLRVTPLPDPPVES